MSSEFLRLHTSTETVVIGMRSALGAGNDLCRLNSEDEVRRRLIDALSDPAALDSLRRFWAIWQSEPIRIDVMPDRMLIERVITATQFGALSVYVVPDGSVKHVFGPPGGKASPALTGGVSAMAPGGTPGGAAAAGASGANAASAAAIPGTVLQTAAGNRTLGAGQGGDPFVWIDRSRLEDRLKVVIERALNVLMMDPRADFTPLLKHGVIAESAEVLATWGRAYNHGLGLIIDALVVASAQIEDTWAIMEAANRLSETILLAGAAHSSRDLDKAARRMAWALTLIGAPAFITAIRRGVDRVQASLARRPRRGPPPSVRQVERRLAARPESSSSPAAGKSEPSGKSANPSAGGGSGGGGGAASPGPAPAPAGTDSNAGSNAGDKNDKASNAPAKYQRPAIASMSNVEARRWYHAHEDMIPDLIDKNAPPEVQARQAFEFRNEIRTAARDAMQDRDSAAELMRQDPNLTWEQMLARKRAQGIPEDKIYESIIKSASKSRPAVDQALGIGRKPT